MHRSAVNYMLKSVFPTLYILQVGLPNVAGPGVTYPPTLPLDGPGCVNNTLINAVC